MAPEPTHEPDPERLKALEEKLAARRQAAEEPSADDRTFSQAAMGWRLVYDMVAGLGIGFGIGYGFDVMFGTKPWLMMIFTLFGLAAGIRVMLRSAQEMNKARSVAEAAGEKENSRG